MIHALEIQLSQIGFAQVAKRIRICDKEMLIRHYKKHYAQVAKKCLYVIMRNTMLRWPRELGYVTKKCLYVIMRNTVQAHVLNSLIYPVIL